MTTVCIGLGSNLDAEANMPKAADLLRTAFPGIRFSSLYASAAQIVENQPAFLNAVARVETDAAPGDTLRRLQEIEHALGKAPPYRFGPRTIDLDFLLHGGDVLPDLQTWKNDVVLPPEEQREELYVPHVRLHERRFALEPLCELIDPLGRHPVLGATWKELLVRTADQDCRYRGPL